MRHPIDRGAHGATSVGARLQGDAAGNTASRFECQDSRFFVNADVYLQVSESEEFLATHAVAGMVVAVPNELEPGAVGHLRSLVMGAVGCMEDEERLAPLTRSLLQAANEGSIADLCVATVKLLVWSSEDSHPSQPSQNELLEALRLISPLVWPEVSVTMVTHADRAQERAQKHQLIEQGVEAELRRRRLGQQWEEKQRQVEEERARRTALADAFCAAEWGKRIRGLGYKPCPGCGTPYGHRDAMHRHIVEECRGSLVSEESDGVEV